jgi:hypothetical protein
MLAPAPRMQCRGAGEIDDGIFRSCGNAAVTCRLLVLDHWAVTVWLCRAHADLWGDEVGALAVRAGEPVPT